MAKACAEQGTSIMCEGSRISSYVSRFQVENMHVMAKVILPDETDQVGFVGFLQPKDRGTPGKPS